MADTLDITEGTGTTIATQDEGGVHYQEVKLTASGTGTTEALSKAEDSAHSSGEHGIMALTVRQNTAASLSGTDADYQPLITDTNGRLHVLDQNSTAILTALQIIDDWDDSDKCNVNINVAGTDVAANAGVLNAQTLRVTIATDDECNNYLGTIDADTSTIAGAVSGTEMQVDVVASLPAGTNAIGKLASNTGVDIGDVDVTSIVPGVAATNLGKAEDAAHASGDVGVMVLAVRDDAPSAAKAAEGDYTPLLTNATGQLYVIDPTGNVLITTGNASLATIAGDTTNIETAIQIIDDWDAVHDSAASSDGPQLMAAYDSTKPTAVADGDAVRVLADASGRLLAGVEPERFQATITSADATSATQVKAKTASKQIHVLSLIISTDTAMNIQLQDDAGTPAVLMEQIYLAANGGMALTFPPEAPLVVTTNQDLDVIASAAGNISVTVTGYLMS